MFDDLRAKANSFEYDQYVSKKKKKKNTKKFLWPKEKVEKLSFKL